LPEGISNLCAPIYVNRTAEAGAEILFTESMRRRLLSLGRLQTGSCDARIEGEITSVSGAVTVVTSASTLASYRLNGTVVLKLVKEGRALSQVTVSGWEDYLPAAAHAGDVLRTEAQRQAALHRLADTLANEGYSRLANAW
jgi:hypothetical protein